MNTSLPPELPREAAQFIGDATLVRDEIGESPCSVYHFERGGDRFFLKTSPAFYAATTYSARREAAALDWLQGRLAVPELVLAAANEHGECLVTRAVPGRPLYALIDEGRPVLALFLEALRQVQSVPTTACPLRADVALRLDELAYLIEHERVADDADLEDWPDLKTPAQVLKRLHATRPEEDLVFSHGDLGDSNVFYDEAADRLHFIDLGRAGLADRWLDIAFVHRNLSEECAPGLAEDFLARLGHPDEPGKRAYFMLLDQLF
ncbi:aminoglycoside 3'-phosphotransferase [Pelomonas sp. CA6]|uniref:APH(3') family aminoglycoside O-phosphotransferase n=1 Tax=Pelomonas sp. CA6 TaxID=2907999 RepID=UPI001F4C4E68|nr:APH(3') family aminoglycoside O-phosphotransferase [Pelomonas sp. CA6]MCH7344462.1 aminoglycoside 3'-phosphotransferase [Pelomonas sp. CA6]